MKNKINSYSKVGNLNNMRNQLPNKCDKQPGIQSEACLIFSLSLLGVCFMIPQLHSILKGVLDAQHYIKTQTQGQPLSTCQHDDSISPAFILKQIIELEQQPMHGKQQKKKRSGFRHIALNLISCRRAPCIKHLQRRKLIRGVARFLFPLSPQTINCVFKKAAAAWWGSSSKATPHIQAI